MNQPLTIGRLAREASLSTETLRHYERLGLIEPARRSAANYRLYGPETARRLVFIRRAQALGFSLAEIRELLTLHRRAHAGASRAKALTEARLREVEAKMADLERMRDGLAQLSAACSGKGSASECPILAALAGSGSA
ncbi:MAG: heavy metal-responsive transcriptional regulator [Gammaproteobacteria bacterium]